jgi:cytochrome c5
MKRLTLVAALATLAVLGGLSSTAIAAEPASAATASVAATEPAADASASFVEPETSFFESSDATCEDFGFFAADKKGECDKSCKKGNKCQRKQVCGDYQCPPPGYCWKCPN